MRYLSRIKHWLLQGWGRLLFASIFEAVVWGELMVQRLVDCCARPLQQHDVADSVTVMVKTFERPSLLHRLLRSIRRAYPDLPVIVVDDSRAPIALHQPGIEMIVLPFDSGVSVGRNAGLRAVRTRYTLVVDDDFIFSRHTDLAPAIAWMDAHPEVDLMGGRVVNLPLFHANDYNASPLFAHLRAPRLPAHSIIDGLPVYEKTAVFFLARTERLKLVGWDDQLTRLDHTDFFTRARGILLTVYNHRLRCFHAQSFMSARYLAARNDYAADMHYLQKKYAPK